MLHWVSGWTCKFLHMLQYLGGPVGFLESWSEVLKDGMASVPHWLII
ncbi:hypothetical protein GLYMA_08G165567v4 [Glycine max]|nr:hypothetical protein GLYMA_08G165567v4 [Glycine max]KAH1051573.1 hypothetical protein GYH30_021461 [Glycine max]